MIQRAFISAGPLKLPSLQNQNQNPGSLESFELSWSKLKRSPRLKIGSRNRVQGYELPFEDLAYEEKEKGMERRGGRS